MEKFSFRLPETDLLFGEGTLSELGTKAKGFGSKALLVTGKGSMRRLGFLERAQKSLEGAGLSVTVFEGVEPNPTVDNVKDGVEAGLKANCDVVVPIGGGSSIDAAKGMAVGIGHKDPDFWSYLLKEKKTTDKTLPLVAVPSTSGTGSHVTWYTVITKRDTEEKGAYSSKYIYPRVSIVDIDVVSTMPQKVTAETGFDVLAHVMESYLSCAASPMTDLLSLRAMELVAHNLKRAYNHGGDLDARYNMALADTYAGMCITPSRTIMVHGLGNTVSGLYPEMAHGQALACLTPPIMRFNIEKGDSRTVSRYCDVAKALGEDVMHINRENALKSVDAVIELEKSIGLNKTFSELGVTEESIEKLTDYSLEHGAGAIACNPVKPTKQDVIDIYKEAL